MSQKRRTLSRTFLINMTLLTFFAVSVFVYIWLSHAYSRFERDVAELRSSYLESRKTRLKNEVERTLNYIRYMNSSTEERLKNLIRERVYEAHSIAMNIYRENKHGKETAEIMKMIKDALRPVRFNSGRGYYFAGNFMGTEQLFADRPEMEGKDLSAMQDTEGRYVIQDMIRIAKEKGEGFYYYTWTKPEELGKNFPKIAFVKHFEPYDWFIGTGEYPDSIKKDIQEEAVRRLANLRFEKDGYLFGSTYKGEPLFSNGKITAGGENIWELTDPNGIKIIQQQRKIAENPEGGFLSYSWHKLDDPQPSSKISFVKGIPEWEWIIGAGVYVDEVESVIREKKELLEARIRIYLFRMFCIFITLLVLVSLMAWYLSRRIRENFTVFFSFFETAATKHNLIELDSLHYAEFERLAVSANRMTEERMRIESALRESEERYRALVHASPAAISIFQDGYMVFTNPAGARIFGFSDPKECSQKPGIEYIAPQYREIILERIRNLDKFRPNQRIEIEIIRGDGSTVPIESVSVPVKIRNRNAALLIIQDISERKKAEDDLKRTKNYLDNILTSSPYAIIGLDREEIITVFNPAAEKLSGICAGEAQGAKFREVMADFTECAEDIRRVMQNRQSVLRERVKKEKNGEIRYYDIIIYPLISDGPEGAVLRIDSVTERIRFEEMMIQTEKMMSVGGLAAGMAHEINNPLGGILQSTQNILRRISPDLPVNAQTAAECGTTLDTVRAYLEKRNIPGFLEGIRISGQKAAEIVQNMLSFSRRSESRMASRDIVELLNKTVELAAHDYDLKKKYDFRQIEIVRDFPPDFPKVRCVATVIEQVILNLLRNAAHAMSENKDPHNPPLIALRLRKEGDKARIEVADNGPGIEEKIRRRIFEPFFTTKEVGEGTGLGLSVSYFIITSNHKGSMSVESEPGKGSCFVIDLPF